VRLFAACVFIFLWASACWAKDVATIDHVDKGFTGIDELQFPVDTALKVAGGPKMQINLLGYKGEFKNGRADGVGYLTGQYVIPATDNLLYMQLQSTDPTIRDFALLLIDRLRGNAQFLGQDPDAIEREVLGQKAIQIAYRGEFREGMATGSGELSSEATGKLKGVFYKWLPEGLVTRVYQDREVLSETFLHGAPADGPVQIKQYPAGLLDPSRIFVGSVKAGKLSGDWYEFLWGEQTEEFTTATIGNARKVVFANGTTSACLYDASSQLGPSALNLDRIRGGVENPPVNDADVAYARGHAACTMTTSDGWVFMYGYSQTGPFTGNQVPPYACTDPQGHSGTLSFDVMDLPECHVTFTKYTLRWGSKLGREMERVAHQVRDAIVNPLTKAGDSTFDVLCDVAQKKRGKNCDAAVSYGHTFEIHDESAQQKQRASEDLSRYMDAKKKLTDEPVWDASKVQWESAFLIYDACAKSCVGPSRTYAMLSIEEIQKILQSGFDDDTKRYQLASMFDGIWQFLGVAVPATETVAASYSGADVINRIRDAQSYVFSLNPKDETQKLRTQALLDSLISLNQVWGAKVGLGLTSEWASLVPTIAFQLIPGLSAENQLAIAIGFGIGHPTEWFKTHREFKTADELVRALIEQKFKEYKVPPPP